MSLLNPDSCSAHGVDHKVVTDGCSESTVSRQPRDLPQESTLSTAASMAFDQLIHIVLALPDYRLPTPVEEAAVGLGSQPVDDAQQMTGCFRRRVDFQSSRCKRSGQ